MKKLSLVLAAAGCLVAVQAASVTSASADMRRPFMSHHDHCQMVRTVMHGPHGKRVDVRRVCR